MPLSKAERERRKASGLCVRCGEEAERARNGKPKTLCAKHLADARKSMQRLFCERRDAGLCTSCGGIPEQGMVRCAACADDANAYLMARRIGANESGLCVRCGYETPAVEGHTLCAAHIEADRREAELERERGKTDAERERREHYRSLGLCPLCGEQPAPGKVMCVRHGAKSKADSQLQRDRHRSSDPDGG